MVEPACEVNEKGTREENDGNELVSMDDNEKIDADSVSFAEEDWDDPEQSDVPKNGTRLAEGSRNKDWQSQADMYEIQQLRV